MSLAIVLDVVRPDSVEEPGDVLLGDVGAERRVGPARMEVEVKAEKSVAPRERLFLRRGSVRPQGRTGQNADGENAEGSFPEGLHGGTSLEGM
jgi:hypothetical protein